MCSKNLLFAFLFFLVRPAAFGQEEAFNTMVPREVVVLGSSKTYPEALQTAKAAARFMNWKLNLRGYIPHPTNGLSASKGACEDDGFDYPCYIARADGGGADDYNTISIEYSNAYPKMAEGYYIVVAGVEKPASRRARIILTQVQKKYPTAYLKRTEVWYGCLH